MSQAEPLPLQALAPAKINLGLFVGPMRPDGRHELVSVMQSISLADELTLERAPVGEQDEVVCPSVGGENLAARALKLFREATGWSEGGVRLTIDKRIPVAAGMGGGSADAAATLRLASAASGLGEESLLLELAAELGADVPAQISPGRWLAAGMGERLTRLPEPVSSFGVLVLPQAAELSTAEVYREVDRSGSVRGALLLEERHRALREELELGAALPHTTDLLHNDLERAAVGLCPPINQALEQTRESGADAAFVSGSGPTVIGLFVRANGLGRAQRAAAGMAGREPPPLVAEPVDASFAQARRMHVRNNASS